MLRKIYLKNDYHKTYWFVNSLLHTIFFHVWPFDGIKMGIFLPEYLSDFEKFSYLHGYYQLYVYQIWDHIRAYTFI